MRGRVVSIMLGLAAIAGGCTTTGTPATAPPATTAPTSSTSTSTSTLPTTTIAPTTTALSRTGAVESLLTDLETRRLVALSQSDLDTFADLFAEGPYRNLAVELFTEIEARAAPAFRLRVLEILRDTQDCIAVVTETSFPDSEEAAVIDTITLQPSEGEWKYAYVEPGRGEWQCVGPHPLQE